MNIRVRPAGLESDRELLIETLSRYLTPLSDDRRFDWLYKGNPHGQARVWIATDTDNDAVVGIGSAFPRRLYFDGHEELVWVLGDFCINNQYRSLGPALQLQRTCLAAVDSGAVAFCYDFPNPGMMAVYRRLGVNPFARILRFARPLRVDRKINAIVKTPLVRSGVAALGNWLLTFTARSPEAPAGLTVSLNEHACGEEFSRLAGNIANQYGMCVHRSAEYLNWRYLANTYCHYEFLTARQTGELLAYAVFGQTGEDGFIVDLFGVDDPAIIGLLVENVVALLYMRGAITVSVPMIEYHPWIGVIQSLGFRMREAKPMVVYAPRNAFNGNSLEEMKWFLMHGDRDS